MTRTLLLDGDIFAYKFATLAEKPIDWGGGLWTLHAVEGDAQGKMDNSIDSIMTKLKADVVKVALTDTVNFRKDILPTYKMTRADTRKPMLLPYLRDYLTENYETWIRPGLEGDDILGILATRKGEDERIIVSIDKDFKTIPGKLFNNNRPEEGIVEVTVEDADFYHMLQTLTGDTTDGYKGCPGVGEVKGTKILKDSNGDYWPAVVAAYAKAGLTEQDALVQARCARILRASDYDFKKKEPKLWTPSTQ